MIAPKRLGEALNLWSISRLPQAEHSPSTGEIALAHGCAFEVSELALQAISILEDLRAIQSWRDVFCSHVGTLAMYGTEETLAQLKMLESRVPPEEVSLRFRTLEALMWFDEERSKALVKMLSLPLPKHLMKVRDYHLEAYLEEPPTFPVDPDERRHLVTRLLESRIEFSTKKAGRAITQWLTSRE